MAQNSKIEWTDHTVNLWWGCSKVHTGCKNCYAEKLSNRFGDNIWGENTERKLIKSAFRDLGKYQAQAKKEGKNVKVFVGSMMDIFEDTKSIIGRHAETRDVRIELFDNISEGKYNNITFLFLTKRFENIVNMIPFSWIEGPLENVWFGASISNQETANDVIKKVNKAQFYNTFLSIEPQIDEINDIDLTYVDWVIQGGESGHNKRPFDIKWAETMRDICKRQSVPYFFKQIDKVRDVPEYLNIKEYPKF